MHFKQFEALLCVIENGSFSKAAEKMYLSQSTVSAYIGALESELDCQLIVRTHKGVFLTEAGKLFYKYAQQILRLRECAKGSIQQYKSAASGVLSAAASTVPASFILPDVLTEFVKVNPRINVNVSVEDSTRVFGMVEDMEVEIGITGYDNRNAYCNSTVLCEDKLVIITANSEKYRSLGGVITKEFLRNAAYVIREPNSGTQKRSGEFLKSIGINPAELKNVIRLQNTESVARTVMCGAGIAIVSKIAVSDKLDDGKLLAFDYDSGLLNRHFYVVTHKYVPLTPVARLFVDFLFQYYQSVFSIGDSFVI